MYKYLAVHLEPTVNCESHYQKIYKAAARRVNLLRHILSSIDTFSFILLVPNEFTNRWLCQYLRIAAIIVLDG